ncbi:hypothetical protein ACJMK2_023093 [Sinanodonta woodiana]|uniref:RRM domain-containing protein n=1 Tax=Sinanodonta woodiana TaxID=1069815 RepID=A0ABD3T3B1_SINWO
MRGVFEEEGIVVDNVVVKRGFAFVDCPDQANVDRAIDKLNGYQIQDSVMQVEPAMSRRRRVNKIQIRNLSPHISSEEIQQLVSTLGPVQKCELAGAEGVVYATFENPDHAQEAVSRLNGMDYQGCILKVDLADKGLRRKRLPDRRPEVDYASNRGGDYGNNRGGDYGNNRGGDFNNSRGGPRNRIQRGPNNNLSNRQELPLRILVGSEFVGAIIGRQGQTIQKITSDTRARVDIHRRDNLASSETVITIKGSPESCTGACKEIMKVVQQEAQSLNKGEYPIKLLCPNNLCGRIIGKGGSVIKAFMEESGSHIVVSSTTDASNFFVDRVITITGSLDNATKAETLVSEKMRKCYEQDMQNYNNQMNMFGNYGGPNVMPNYAGGNYPSPRSPFQYSQQPQMGNSFYPGLFSGPTQQPPQQLEVTYLYIPESTVGAVIGSKGSNIKNIMRLSNARIKILAQNKNGETNGEKRPPSGRTEERKVIITGTPEAQWKAQFYIVEKIKTEGGFAAMEDVHLRSEIMVPKTLIGRIIGKGGQNVKEMQRVSGAIVKTPDTKTFPDAEEVPVTIIGHFYASQSAQRRIRALVIQSGQGSSGQGQGAGRRPMQQQNGN